MRIPFHWRVLTGMGLGVLAGSLSQPGDSLLGIEVLSIYAALGALFVNALKMVAVPLVMTSVISGVARSGCGATPGRMWLRTLAFYVLTTAAAVLVAVALLGIIEPGLVNGTPAGTRMAFRALSTEVAGKLANGPKGLTDVLLGIVPPNLFEAARGGNLLGLVFFSVLMGYSLIGIGSERARPVIKFFEALSEAMMRMTGLVLQLAPLGVFALVARTVAISGFSATGPLLLFSGTVVAGLLLYSLALLPLLVRLAARANPWTLFPAMTPALLTAFSTASSSGALATSIDCVERRVGVPARVGSFVMPLGASLNHAGTALYECAAVLFLSQAYGVALTFSQQCLVAVMALGTSMGMAGIPGASLVAIAAILGALGLPAEALGALLVFDRILDMCRTAVNVFADACCAVIVAKLEGEPPKPAGHDGTCGTPWSI